MKVDTLFVNGTIVTHSGRFAGCIGVKDGRIAFVAQSPDGICEAAETVDVGGKYILPGVIDAHVHPQDPGPTHREDFEHATASAAAGGISTIISMPKNAPPAHDIATYEQNVRAYDGRGYVDYALHGGGTATNVGDAEDLWNKTGATAIKMFMCFSVTDFPFVQDDALYQHLEICAKNNGIAIIHAENNEIINMMEAKLKAAGRKDGLAYNASHPDYAEVEAIKRALFFIERTGARALIVHVSTAEGLRLVREARARGLDVYAETCPHFLTFVSHDMIKHGPYLKFSPPMHEEPNRQELWKLLRDGFVDTVGSDHCPYEKSEKDAAVDDIWKAPNGIPGLENLVPVLLDGVNKGQLTLERAVEVLCYNPAKIFGLDHRKGSIAVGLDADLTIVDLDLRKTYTDADRKSKCGFSPYFGMEFVGWPVQTYVRGHKVYDHGTITGTLGHGQFIARPKP